VTGAPLGADAAVHVRVAEVNEVCVIPVSVGAPGARAIVVSPMAPYTLPEPMLPSGAYSPPETLIVFVPSALWPTAKSLLKSWLLPPRRS
jgi:hypothetical protein